MLKLAATPPLLASSKGLLDPPSEIRHWTFGVGRSTFAAELNAAFRIIAADHTGITVLDLERSLAFWRDVLGLELSHTAHQTGEMAEQITGVKGAELKLAVLRTPTGHKIELLEYLAPADRKCANLGPCDLGHVHVALLVNDLAAVLERIAAS